MTFSAVIETAKKVHHTQFTTLFHSFSLFSTTLNVPQAVLYRSTSVDAETECGEFDLVIVSTYLKASTTPPVPYLDGALSWQLWGFQKKGLGGGSYLDTKVSVFEKKNSITDFISETIQFYIFIFFTKLVTVVWPFWSFRL